eukprot:1317198-Amorphochlora_amoeboformis.AAC.2
MHIKLYYPFCLLFDTCHGITRVQLYDDSFSWEEATRWDKSSPGQPIKRSRLASNVRFQRYGGEVLCNDLRAPPVPPEEGKSYDYE